MNDNRLPKSKDYGSAIPKTEREGRGIYASEKQGREAARKLIAAREREAKQRKQSGNINDVLKDAIDRGRQ